MLTPDFLDRLTDEIVELYEELNGFLVRDVVRRLIKTGRITESAAYQTDMLQQSGMLRQEIIKEVARLTRKSIREVENLFNDSAAESLKLDDRIYKAAGLNPLPIKQSPGLYQMLLAGVQKTNGLLYNLTLTTANASQTAYIKACNTAYFQTSTGAVDYISAIRSQIKAIADSGADVLYPSGHSDKLDVAVRRSVLTGVAQTTGVLSENRAADVGCDLMEITSHAGARPSHARWQGKVVSLSGRRGYLSKADIGYGDGNGFKGWNCRHDWYPFFEGISEHIYKPDDLEKLNEKSIEYGGNQYTVYEATQIQREFERSIRKSKRNLAAFDEAIKATGDESLINALKADFTGASVKLKSQEQQMQSFLDATGLLKDKSRTQVVEFGRGVSQRAVWANRRATR